MHLACTMYWDGGNSLMFVWAEQFDHVNGSIFSFYRHFTKCLALQSASMKFWQGLPERPSQCQTLSQKAHSQ